MTEDRPPLDLHPLSEYVACAGGRNREPILGVLKTHELDIRPYKEHF